jgi:tRNA A37 methylthiotransferase MiaB
MAEKKIYIDNLGCYRRSLDATNLKEYFQSNDCRVVDDPRHADSIIVITCAVFKAPEDNAIARIKELREKYPGKVVVTGCLPAINAPRLNSVHDGAIIPIQEIRGIDKLFPDFKVRYDDIPDANTFTGLKYPAGAKEALLAFRYNSWNNYRKVLYYLIRRSATPFNIRISWGCRGSCTYCGIRKAVGVLRSKPTEQCLAELDRGVATGVQSFPLLADDLGAYGMDVGSDLPNLIDAMLNRHPHISLTLNDLHPRWMIQYGDRLLPHIASGRITEVWCPAQSGSDRILGLMRRFNGARAARDALLSIKSASPGCLIHSHLICGFPSETEGDWEQSLALIKESKVDMVLVFPYMKAAGSKAASMAEHVDPETVRDRLKRGRRYFRENGVAAMFYDVPAEPNERSWAATNAEALLSRPTEKVLGAVASALAWRASTSSARTSRRV